MAETEPQDGEMATVQMENQSTMEMFLERALRSIFAEATTKRTTRLRESCHTTLGMSFLLPRILLSAPLLPWNEPSTDSVARNRAHLETWRHPQSK